MRWPSRRTRRRLYLVVAGLGLAGLGSVVVPPARRAVWEPLAARGLAEGLGRALGGTASVERLAWVRGGVELTGVSWHAAEGPARLSLEEARAELDLRRLVRGDLEGVRHVRAAGVDLVWRVEPSPDAEPDPPSELGPPAPFGLSLPTLPGLELERLDLDVAGPGWSVVGSGLRATHDVASHAVEVDAPALRVATGPEPLVDGAVTVRGELAPDAWTVRRLTVGDDLAASLALREGDASQGHDSLGGEFEVDWGPAHATGTVAWSADELAGAVSLAPLAVEDLPGDPAAGVTGKVELVVDLSWPTGRGWTDAAVEATASVVDARVSDVVLPRAELTATADAGVWNVVLAAPRVEPAAQLPPIEVDAAVRWTEGVATVERLRVETPDGTRVEATGTLPLALGDVRATGDAPLAFDLEARVPDLSVWEVGDLVGEGHATGTLRGSFAAPVGRLDLDVRNARWADSPAGSVVARVRMAEELVLEALEVELPELATLSGSGRWALPASPDAWSGDDALDWRAAELSADVEFDCPELARLALRSESLRRLSGRVAARGSVRGSLAEPTYEGSGDLKDGRLDFQDDLPSLAGLELAFEVAPGVARVARGSGRIGGAPFELSGEYAFGGERPEVQAHVRGDNLLFARSRTALLRGDVDVRVAGPVEALSVTGAVDLTTGLVASRIEVLSLLEEGRATASEEGIVPFSLRAPPLSEMKFDVAVTASRQVVFENNVVDLRVRPDLRLRGTGEVPELVGSVYVDAGVVSLPGSSLRIERGLVRFDPADPFVPEVSVEGRTKTMGYEIRVQVAGPYDEPEVTLRSSPALASDDALVLLLTGQLPASVGTRAGRSSAGQTVALYFGKDLLAKWFASDDPLSDEESFFERFEFSTGQELSAQGVPTVDASFRLREDVWRDDDHLLLTLERDVWEDYNLGLRWVVRLK